MIQKEVLHGGREGKISKEEDKVIRPGNKWTLHVQSFLSFMHENEFNNIPKPYGISESGMEMVSFVDGCVHGIIDFDTLHPGPRIWDVAYAVYRWIPFVSPKNPDYCYNLNEQIRRLKLFVDTYDLKNHEREQLPNMIIERISSLVAYMRNEADSGNEDVQKNIEDGHLNLYLDDIQYIKESRKNILEGIL